MHMNGQLVVSSIYEIFIGKSRSINKSVPTLIAISLHRVWKPFSMVANPSGARSGTTWSPPKDEEEKLSSEGSVLVDGKGGGDGEA